MKSDSLSPQSSGGFPTRLRQLRDAGVGSLRELVRRLIPFEYRRRLVRFVRRRLTAWDYAASQATSLKALENLLDHSTVQKYDVICFPIIDWDFRFQRPQQLMSQFALAGHRVFYVKQDFREYGPSYDITIKVENVFEVSLRGPDRNVYGDSLTDHDVSELLAGLSELRRDLSLGATAIVVQLPFWRPLVEAARKEFSWPITYDCMDYHAGFSTNRPTMLEEERHLVACADCVIVSSPFLEREVDGRAKNMLLVRNGCDYDHFAQIGTHPVEEAPTIGYYGAIADWFDTDLVLELARKRPDWRFLLVGSTFSADLGKLRMYSNISLVGEQPYAELPHWIEKMDVLILPFKRSALTEATNPVKAYEILAAGKPLVSVPIEEMVGLHGLVELASSADEFEAAITRLMAENESSKIETRRDFAKEHTWQARFAILQTALHETFPLVSVIIVTYGNLELNRICLQSLFTNTEWPRLEVIVVDNASRDGTPEYLRSAATQHENLRVILNDENRGFAAANNQGLEVARGDFLVLLNNDTAVPRGWLSSLVRHLSSDDSIGLIGPVTNQIGNEARITVGYSNLADMPAWAVEYTRLHDNEVFEIPMLAMYCVAMRRAVFEKVGFLDERFGIGMFEDDDYTRRVRGAGFKIRCTQDAFVHHAGGASFNKLQSEEYFRLFDRNRALFEEKWGERWQAHEDDATKATIPRLRSQLREILAANKDGKATVVSLPAEEWQSESPGAQASVARALSQAGSLVFFDCTGGRDDSFFGFRKVTQSLYLYRGPSGVLEQIKQPILLALACHWKSVSKWSEARIVYNCTPEQTSRFGEGHQRLIEIAQVIIESRSVGEGLEEDGRLIRGIPVDPDTRRSFAERVLGRSSSSLGSHRSSR